VSDPDWLALLTATDGYSLTPPSPKPLLDRAQAVLGMRVPQGLRALYGVTDGVFDKSGEWQVIWSVEELLQRNLSAYDVESSQRQALVGFGDDGTGNPFCFRREGGEAVYFWSPIDQEATRLAEDAADFWSLWTTDRLPPH
jgi:hypothetical protein